MKCIILMILYARLVISAPTTSDESSCASLLECAIFNDHLPDSRDNIPQKYKTAVGDSAKLSCLIENFNGSISWRRQNGQPLPTNQSSFKIICVIDYTQRDAAGIYECFVEEANGTYPLFTAELVVVGKKPTARNETKPLLTEHADVGSNVMLNCNPGQYANRYHWSRQAGHFALGTNISSSDLLLENVQAKDAGIYICTASVGSESVETSTTLIVTGVIPYFAQAPKSYLTFPKLDDSGMKFNFEITFNPDHPNGLILYNGQKHGEGNYIALFLNDGHPEFRYDFGNGPVVIRAEKPIELKTWHTVKVNKIRKEGYLLVDDRPPVTFPEIIRTGVELLENLYVGGVPNYNHIVPSAVSSTEGFVGCISRLILKDREIELKQDPIATEGITSCETCANDPCENDGTCLESQTEQGFTCLCKSGFTGKTCAVEGLSCSPGICGSGRCENSEQGIDCYCPLNKTGDRCEYNEHLDGNNLSFKDGSFAAFRTPTTNKINISFNVRPESNQDSVILYVAESNRTSGDYVTVVIKDKHYEFRFNSGGRILPVIIRSKDEVDVNKWTKITISRRHAEGTLKVGDANEVRERVVGPERTMYLRTHLYVGGYDKRIFLNKNVEVNRGFDGCISDLEVSLQSIDMLNSILDGANIQNCGYSNETNRSDELDNLICRPGYGGADCEEVIDACAAQDPCENHGICESKGSSLHCNCPIHYSGYYCQYHMPIEFATHYKGNGYTELNRSALVKSANESDILLAFMFSTTAPNGLIVWYGQNKGEAFNGQDFIALAIVDGYIEFALRLDGEETVLKNSNSLVNNGTTHRVIIIRTANQATLELDFLSTFGETKETGRTVSNLPGNIFMGGAPDIATLTGNRYTQGFEGCIYIVEGTDTRAINIEESAVAGYNVVACPKS